MKCDTCKHYDETTKIFKDLIDAGWVIWATACSCGGKYAWLEPMPSGTHRMYGCICHNLLSDKTGDLRCQI